MGSNAARGEPAGDDRLRTLVDVIKPLGADLELPAVLDRIIHGACLLVGARYGALGVLGPDGRQLSGFHTHGMDPETVARVGAVPQGAGVLGLLMRDPRPLRLHDLTTHPDASGFPTEHPPMRTFLGAPIRIRDRVFGNIYLTEKVDGGDFTAEDEALLVSLAGAAGAAIDNARLYSQSQIRQRWSGATVRLAQSLLESDSDDPSVALMAEQVRALSDAAVTAVAILDGADRLELRAVDRATCMTTLAGDPSGTILAGTEWTDLLSARQPILHVGHGHDPRARPARAARELLGLEATAPLALVPLGTGPRAIGVLLTGWNLGEEGKAREVLPLQLVYAVQAGVAILAALSHADRARLALLEERERIARDMHDNVIQRLFATGLSLQSATPLAVHPVVRTRLNRAVDELDRAIKEIRQAIFELHSEDSSASLDSTLRAIAQSYAASLGFAPEVTVADGLGALPDELRADVVAVAREGLANVARHAGARTVSLRVTTEDGLSVQVVDDGSGFDPAQARSGLLNLRGRAVAHGGELEIRSGPGSGTVLHWRVPRD